jgi:hypothetical protein
MSSEKHFSLPERQKYFPASSRDLESKFGSPFSE